MFRNSSTGRRRQPFGFRGESANVVCGARPLQLRIGARTALVVGHLSLGLLFVIGAFRATSLPLASGLLAFTLLTHETRRGSSRGAFEIASSGGSGTRSRPRARFRLASTPRAPVVSLLV